jgi:thiol-disulfide isomerase/thioredoxin
MNSLKEIGVILILMIVSGLAGFVFYQYIIAPRTQVNIIDTGQPLELNSLRDKAPTPPFETVNTGLDLSALVVKDLQANPVALDQWPGKALVINFWATWCPPCRKEIPLLIETQNQTMVQNVQFLGIAMDDPKDVAKYMQSAGFNYPILISDMNETIRIGQAFDYNFIALPFTLFVSADGKTTKAYTGELKAEKLRNLISAVSP